MEIDREELIKVFTIEAKEQLDTLESGLLELEKCPTDAELLQGLFRAAHSLKGNASIVQLTSIGAFTHSLEDVLERVRGGAIPVTPELVSVLLHVVDAFRRIVPRALEGWEDPQEEHAELVAWLEAKQYGAGRAASPTPGDATTRDALPTAHVLRSQELTPSRDAQRLAQNTLRVDVRKLDRMLDLVGEITIARGRLDDLLERQSQISWEELRSAHRDADRLYLDLQEQLMRARMVPLGPTFRRYQRVVRDLALERGKDVRLVIEGEDVEVDTAVVEGLKDPLTHMIRNAVDHGIETPAQRTALGKTPQGTIVLSARHEGGKILIVVSDDGTGLDRAALLQRARALELVRPGEEPSAESLARLIFEPGFSTATRVTEVSGRGIGMSVVHMNIEALRGSVMVASEPGAGTRFTVALPLTLAIIEGFSVGVGDETYVLPLDAIVECVDLPEVDRGTSVAQGYIDRRGKPLPYLRLGSLFGLPRTRATRESLVVLQHDGDRAGLAVDTLQGAGQTVIKPLASLVNRGPTVAGCALLGSGRVALILDVPAIFRAARASVPDALCDQSETAALAATP